MAYSMVTIYGMNDKLGHISYYDSKGQNEYSFSKPYSESTAKLIDEEVKKLIDLAYSTTKDLLVEKRHQLDLLAKALLEREIIYQHDLVEIIGERPFDKPTVYQEFLDKKDPEAARVSDPRPEDQTTQKEA